MKREIYQAKTYALMGAVFDVETFDPPRVPLPISAD